MDRMLSSPDGRVASSGTRMFGLPPARQSVLVIGVVLVVAILAGFALDTLLQRERALERAQWRAETAARLLQERVERVLHSSSTVMASLAARLAVRPSAARALEDEPVLADTLRRLPWLQALVVIDPRGRVQASTDPALRDQSLPLPVPAEAAGGGADRLGQAVVLPVGQQTVIPLWRPLSTPEGERLLVAWIYPAGLLGPATGAGGLLEPGAVAELLDARGTRLARFEGDGDDTAPPAPDQADASALRVQLTLAEGPAVRVQHPLDAALRPWRADLRRRLPLLLLALGGVAAMTVLARRGLRRRERARRQRDAALRAAAVHERELEDLLHSLRELVFRTDADGRLTRVNERWSLLSGEAGTVRGQPLWALVAPEDRECVRLLFAPAAIGPAVREGRFRARGADGALRHFDVSVVPLGADGGFAGSAVDVSARAHADDRLRARLAGSEQLFESSPLPLSLADEAGRLLAVNRAWELFRGLPREQVLGRSVGDIVPEEARQAPGVEHRDTLVFLRDGSRREVQFRQSVLRRPDGAPDGTLTVTLDVSAFRRAERVTRQSQQAAEAALRARTERVARLGRELRAPLRCLLGVAEQGRGQAIPALHLHDVPDDLHAAGQRALALVDELLELPLSQGTQDPPAGAAA